MATTLLQVNPLTRTYVMEGCRTPSEQDFLLTSGEVVFSGRLRGAPIRFPVVNPRPIRFQGGLACSADFPERLEFSERRRHPRVLVSPGMDYKCSLLAPGGKPMELNIDNVSQAGVGFSSPFTLSADLPAGTIMHRCSLDFGVHGSLQASLQAAGHGTIRRHDRLLHLVGCTFLTLSASQRTLLQRLVYQLEMSGREAARSLST